MIVFRLHRSTHSTSPPLCWTKCATTSLWSRCGTRHLAQPLMMRYGSSDGPVLYDQLCTCMYSPLCCSYTCMYICSKILGDILLHCPSQYFHTMILPHVHVQSCIHTLGYTGSICKLYSYTQLYYSIYALLPLCSCWDLWSSPCTSSTWHSQRSLQVPYVSMLRYMYVCSMRLWVS